MARLALRGRADEESDHWHRRLLRPRPNRPRHGRAAKQADDIPAFHGAPTSSGDEQSTPSAPELASAERTVA
jgi:hypothetical protein